MANSDGHISQYFILANHNREEYGVTPISSEEVAMREVLNYQENGRNIDGEAVEFPSPEAAEAYAKGKYPNYQFLPDYIDVLKTMESDPRPR
jgi:hypothetical protein